jgi:hypothetical protein
MTLILDLSPEMESRLEQAAARSGMPIAEYAKAVLERQVLPLALRVAAMPPEEQDRILTAAAEQAAELYNADLSLPPSERELAAFTALDGDQFSDGSSQS